MVFAVSTISVGRESDSLLVIPAESISRHHAVLRRLDDGSWQVEDTESINGVKVNRTKIDRPVILCEDDLIEFGDQMIRVAELDAVVPKVVFSSLGEEPVTEPAAENPPAEAAAGMPSFARTRDLADLNADKTVDLSEALKNGKLRLFGSGSEGGRRESGGGEPGRKRLFSNRLFYTVLGCAVVVGLAMFYIVITESEQRGIAARAATVNPAGKMLLFYEKEIISPDNVFLFSLHIENGAAEFVIDDLKSRRRFLRKIDVLGEGSLDMLRSTIERSGFMNQAAVARGGSVREKERRRLVVGDGRKLNEVEVINNAAPKSFSEVEYAIGNFAETYGLQTIALTPDELIESARNSFIKAEDLFANREAKLSNLREAIQRYKITTDYMEQFSPKPELWEKARQRLEEAEQIRQQKLQDLNYERIRLANFQNFESLRFVLRQIMELCDPDSKEYEANRDRLLKLDRHLNRTKKK